VLWGNLDLACGNPEQRLAVDHKSRHASDAIPAPSEQVTSRERGSSSRTDRGRVSLALCQREAAVPEEQDELDQTLGGIPHP
jgi:hypothetical protein